MPPFECSFDRSRLDVGAIHAFLSGSYWSLGIPRQTVERAIENSLCIGGYVDGRQVAFARMVTDRATFAYLADVFVLASHRGRGLSRTLVETLLSHPEVQGLRRMRLVTRDAHGLYAKLGFSPLAHQAYSDEPIGSPKRLLAPACSAAVARSSPVPLVR
jgi:N-acetylglutamate synthase-like GNAT family acetyltransferase